MDCLLRTLSISECGLAQKNRFRLTNHIVGGVGVGPGFDGWLFPGEPRRRR
jgi:hypothetical protein